MHIYDIDFGQLPNDPVLALVEVDKFLRKSLPPEIKPDSFEDYYDYISLMNEFMISHGLMKEPIKLPSKFPSTSENVSAIRQTMRTINASITRSLLSRLKKDQEDENAVVKLNNDEKQTIHQYLNEIRQIVENSPLDYRKKNSIVDKINELAKEVDKDKTAMNRFFGLMIDTVGAVSSAAKKADPILDRFERIVKIGANAKSRNEDDKMLSPPPKRLTYEGDKSSGINEDGIVDAEIVDDFDNDDAIETDNTDR